MIVLTDEILKAASFSVRSSELVTHPCGFYGLVHLFLLVTSQTASDSWHPTPVYDVIEQFPSWSSRRSTASQQCHHHKSFTIKLYFVCMQTLAKVICRVLRFNEEETNAVLDREISKS